MDELTVNVSEPLPDKYPDFAAVALAVYVPVGAFSDMSKVYSFETVFCDVFPILYENVTFAFVVPGRVAVYKLAEPGATTVVFWPGLRFALKIAKHSIA